MSSEPPSNVKIYDRPERKGPSPLVLAIGLIMLVVVGFLLYRAFFHTNTSPVKTQSSIPSISSAASLTRMQINTLVL